MLIFMFMFIFMFISMIISMFIFIFMFIFMFIFNERTLAQLVLLVAADACLSVCLFVPTCS